jgi:hypothetical protein
VAQQQAASVDDLPVEDSGPALYSGLWTHVYSAALHGVGIDTVMWITTRAVSGTACQASGPTNTSTCVPAIWYGQVANLLTGDPSSPLFGPSLNQQGVIYHSQISMAFPTVAINSNGSALFQFSYASNAFDDVAGVVALDGQAIWQFPGVCVCAPTMGASCPRGGLPQGRRRRAWRANS